MPPKKTPAPSVSPSEALKAITSQPEAPALIAVLAKDVTRRERAIAAIVDRFRSPQSVVSRYRADELSARDVVSLQSSCMTYALFGGATFHCIGDIEDLPSAHASSIAALADQCTSAARIIVSGKSLLKSSPIRAAATKLNAILELPELEGPSLASWTQRELQRAGLTEIGNGVIETLLEISEQSVDSIAQRVNHLALYCSGPAVSLRDIKELFVSDVETSDFALPDLIAQGKAADAIAIACRLIYQGKSAFPLLAITNRNLQQILSYHEVTARGGDAAAKNSLGVPPWLLQKIAGAARKIDRSSSRRALEFVLRADSKLKGRNLSHEDIFSELIQGVIR